MEPWTIIGWAIIGVVCVPIILKLLALIAYMAIAYYLHRKTRNTPFRNGQIWTDGGSRWFKINTVFRSDGVNISPKATSYSTSSWFESNDDFRNRINVECLYLDNPTERPKDE